MPHVFLYEFITGGGLLGAEAPTGSLLTEGAAMILGLAADFAVIPNCRVTLVQDSRLTGLLDDLVAEVRTVHDPIEHDQQFAAAAAGADYTIVIAPEFDGLLLRATQQALAAGGRLLCPGPDLIRLASDKTRTAEHLTMAGIPATFGGMFGPPHDDLQTIDGLDFPVVVKPNDGAGSTDVMLVHDPHGLATALIDRSSARIEAFVPGRAASVALLMGSSGYKILPPCWQHLTDDGHFTYLGGQIIDEAAYRNRAERLALRVAELLRRFDDATGYIGIDIVLGDSPAKADAVIEINPRLTTSYTVVRQGMLTLAANWLQIAG